METVARFEVNMHGSKIFRILNCFGNRHSQQLHWAYVGRQSNLNRFAIPHELQWLTGSQADTLIRLDEREVLIASHHAV